MQDRKVKNCVKSKTFKLKTKFSFFEAQRVWLYFGELNFCKLVGFNLPLNHDDVMLQAYKLQRDGNHFTTC